MLLLVLRVLRGPDEGQGANTGEQGSSSSSGSGGESSSSTGGMGGAGGMGGMGGAGVCGDGVISGAEECEDGNTNPDDRCDKCQVVCLQGEHEFSGNHHCYVDFNVAIVTYSSALVSCDGKGGKLVSITSQAEQDFVFNSVLDKSIAHPRWIGLTDLATEGMYKWESSEPVAYTHWLSGQPDNFQDSEDCVEMFQGTGEWNDDNCTYEYEYICEFIPAGI
jgi:cysteine-rich repeat protein